MNISHVTLKINGSTLSMFHAGWKGPLTLASQHPATHVWRANLDQIGLRIREVEGLKEAMETIVAERGEAVEFFRPEPKVSNDTPEAATKRFRKYFATEAAKMDARHGAENWHATGNTTIGYQTYITA